MKPEGSFGCSNHDVVECRLLGGTNKVKNKTMRQYFGLFRNLLGRIAWDTVLERRRVQKSWLISKDLLLQAQEW